MPADLGLGREALPVRKMPGRVARTSWRGFSASHKIESDAMRFFESTLERDLHTLLSADPDVVRFAVQPHRLTYWAEESGAWPVKRSYVPDVLAQLKSGACVIYEAKSVAFAEAEPWRSREPFIRKAYRDDHGLELVVLTEHDIRVQPRLANCQMMLQHRPFVADPATLLLLRQTLETMDFPTAIGMMVDRAIERGAEAAAAFSVIVQMVMSGELIFQHDRLLSPDCLVSK